MGNDTKKPTKYSAKIRDLQKEKQTKLNTDLTDDDYDFLSKITKLNRSAIKEIFDKFYENNTKSHLNKEEFAKLYCSLRYEPYSQICKIVDLIFNAFDTNKDGKF